MIALSEESDKKAESEAENAKANANADRQKALRLEKRPWGPWVKEKEAGCR